MIPTPTCDANCFQPGPESAMVVGDPKAVTGQYVPLAIAQSFERMIKQLERTLELEVYRANYWELIADRNKSEKQKDQELSLWMAEMRRTGTP